MKRFVNIGSLTCVVGLAAGALLACSAAEGPMQREGADSAAGNTVRFALQPVSGITLNTLHFVVLELGSTTPVLEGELPTPGDARLLTLGLPVPVGSGYELSLSGVAAESSSTICVGSVGPFEVRPNQLTNLTTPLECVDIANGTLKNEIKQTVDGCPRLIIDFALASPNTAKINEPIALASYAHDLDSKPIGYAWTIVEPGIGTFPVASGANGTFTCRFGDSNVALTMTASNGECSRAIVTNVTCSNIL